MITLVLLMWWTAFLSRNAWELCVFVQEYYTVPHVHWGWGWGKKKIINGMRGKRSYINKGHVISWCTIHTLKGYKQVTWADPSGVWISGFMDLLFFLHSKCLRGFELIFSKFMWIIFKWCKISLWCFCKLVSLICFKKVFAVIIERNIKLSVN